MEKSTVDCEAVAQSCGNNEWGNATATPKRINHYPMTGNEMEQGSNILKIAVQFSQPPSPNCSEQGRIHGPKGVGAEQFRLAPSALATFYQFYVH